MTAPVLDRFLLDLSPAPPLPVADGLLRARSSVMSALAALSEVPDAALEGPWHSGGLKLNVRNAFFRQYEALEDTRSAARPMLAGAAAGELPGRPLVAAATAARWDLHGLLAGLTDDDLDRDPGGGEWSIRQTLAHIVGSQRAFGWFTAWWLAQRHLSPDTLPAGLPDEVAAQLPDEEAEAPGAMANIQRRLDDTLDLSAGAFAALGPDDLAVRARGSGGRSVDIRYRIGRWPSHLHEHTIQIEKTLAPIDRPPTEVQRLLRLIAGAYGRLEEELFMWPAGAVAEALARVVPAVAAISEESGSIREVALRG